MVRFNSDFITIHIHKHLRIHTIHIHYTILHIIHNLSLNNFKKCFRYSIQFLTFSLVQTSNFVDDLVADTIYPDY